MAVKPDFSGYATKNDLVCSDGRTIRSGAFKHNDKMRVPLVWQHQHHDPENILGYAILEHRDNGVYAYGYFNETPKGKVAKQQVQHGDVRALSIFANNLAERDKNVLHGDIKEVSLVLSGANPGAFIENIYIQHGDSLEQLDGEAIIYSDVPLEHTDIQEDNVTITHADAGEKTVKEVFDSMSKEQQDVVYFMIGAALEDAEGDDSEDDDAAAHSDIDITLDAAAVASDIAPQLIHSMEELMTRNVFEQAGSTATAKPTLSHAQIKTIVDDAQKRGSFKEAFLAHAVEYGIENIDVMFPDAKALANSPDLISRRMEWVSEVINGTKHSPFARIKTIAADITADEARARGYVKGNLKKEEIVRLLGRKTTPTTIYKKQRLDRDDILDITDLDVVAWLKAEMRLMLDEELARAILLGDGREYGDEDKIDEENIRPITKDHSMYAHPVTLPADADVEAQIESLIRARANYRGTGQPVFFTTLPFLTDMLLHKDKVGRRVYDTIDALASALMVSKIVTVEVMEQAEDLVGVFVNLSDYTIGANRGGEVSMFDDFDIDYNQYKYLIETRVSGALTKPKSAVVVRRSAGQLVSPTAPSFDGETNTITFPTVAGVEYTVEGIVVTGEEEIDESTDVVARPKPGYSFPTGATNHWNFTPSSGV